MLRRDRRDVWDAPDHIEDAEIDRSDSSSDELSNATKYVITSAGSPTIVLRKAHKRAALRRVEPKTSSRDKISVFRSVQGRKKI